MYWSGYDTSILITGILTLILALIPGTRSTNQTRFIIAGVGAGLIVISIITGNLQSVTYPSVVTIAPAFPVVTGIIMILRARNLAAADRQSVDVSASTTQASETPAPKTKLLAQASDPSTSRSTLADLAYEHPELRVAVAANPSTYPGLLTWLGELDDPEIDRALADRLPKA